MAGYGKGKKKKNKGKSNNSHKYDRKQKGTLNHNLDDIQKHTDDGGGSEETGKTSLPMLEEVLGEKIQLLYKKALERLLALGYRIDIATRAILLNGHIFGEANILTNILVNSLAVIKMEDADGKFGIEPLLRDVNEMARFSMRTLINMIIQDRPNMTMAETVLFLLQSNAFAVQDSPVDSGRKGASEVFIEKMLKEKAACFKRMSPGPTAPSSKKEVTSGHCTPGESSSGDYESRSLDFLKSLDNCTDKASFDDLLRSCSEDLESNLIPKLVKKVEDLTRKVNERRNLAKKIVIQKTSMGLNASRIQLRDLKLDKNETERLVEPKEELDDGSSIVSKKVGAQDDYEIKAKTIAYETEKSLSEAHEKTNVTEKHVHHHLKSQIAEVKQEKEFAEFMKQWLAETRQRPQQVNEAQEQAKLKLKQEEKVKAPKNSERSWLPFVRPELNMKYGPMMDDKDMLQQELSELKATQDSSKATPSSSTAASSIQSSPKQRVRQCIICRRNDATILFLPCADRLICSDCNEEVYEALGDCCPHCKAQIEKRV